MLTLFDERSKSEVELKDFVDPAVLALSLHFIYDGHMPSVRKKILTQKSENKKKPPFPGELANFCFWTGIAEFGKMKRGKGFSGDWGFKTLN